MTTYTYADWHDPSGFDGAEDRPPAPQRPRQQVAPVSAPIPQQFFNPMTGRPWRAGEHGGVIQAPAWSKPTMGNTPAPPQRPSSGMSMQQWMNTAAPKPSPQSTANQPPQKPAAHPPTLGGGSISPDIKNIPEPQHQSGGHHQQGFQEMFGNPMTQHFDHHNNMMEGVNRAMANAADQWSDAAAREQAYQHSAMQADQQNQMQMEQMRSNERIAGAELQDRAQKRQALMSIAGGFTPTISGGGRRGGMGLLGQSLLG